ncbi:extracellular solute-binding protein [Kitasatospora sp. NPDC002040]|uniref:extracellular solute-binding protein n=1 Tax=Kitasatospora sp. NPDC002040 TaxID=3154661 RepID=UPI00331D0158
MFSAARKPVLSLTALAASSALLLSGCGSNVLGSGGDVTLRLVVADYGDSPANSSSLYWSDLVKRFESANSNIKVELEVVSWDDIDKRVAELIKTGKVPDILQTGGFADQVAAGRLYPVSEVLTIDAQVNTIDAFAKAGQVLGSQYGIPFIASSRAFFYNKAIFEKAGISQPPTSWEELRKDAKLIKQKVPGVVPYGLPLGPEEAQAESLMWTMSGGGGLSDDTGNYSIDSSANKATFDWLRTSLVKDGLTYGDPGAVSRKTAFADFAAGKVAMLNGHPSLVQKSVAAKIDYGLAPIPRKDPASKAASFAVADWMMAFKANGHRAEIKKFLSFAYQKENTLKFYETYNMLPVTQDAREEMAADAAHADLKPFLNALPDAHFYPYGEPSWGKVSEQIKKDIGGAVKDGGGETLARLQSFAGEAAADARK